MWLEIIGKAIQIDSSPMCTAKSLNQHKLTSVFGHGQYVGTLFTQIAEARFVERT